MALTEVAPRGAKDEAPPERRSFLGNPWLLAAAAAGLLLAFGWSFLLHPTLFAPTRDPAWYTWRAELLQHAPPASLVKNWPPLDLFSGGYRVTTPALGALLMRVAGMDRFTWTALDMVAVPVLASLGIGAFAYRHRRDPLLFLLTLLAAGGLFLTIPYIGYMDNVMCLMLLAMALPFIGPARTSWGARSALFLLMFLAALTHPTTLVIFILVLAAGAGLHLLTSRFSFKKTLEADGPMLIAAGLGAVFGLAMWKVGMWGLKAPFAAAATPPPYPASFFRARLGQWVGSLKPAITGPLVAVAIASIGVAVIKRKETPDEYPRFSLLWLLPLAGLFGFVAGLTYPYYRFMNTTLAIMLLAGMGAWVAARWVLSKGRAVGLGGVAIIVAALAYLLSAGLSSWNSANPNVRWLNPDTRVTLASVEAYAKATPSDRPFVFVIDYRDSTQAYGWAKTFSNVSRTALTGDEALRSFIYFGDVKQFLAGKATTGTNPTFRKVTTAFAAETFDGLRPFHGVKPVVFLVGHFNAGTANDAVLKQTSVSGQAVTPIGSDVVVVGDPAGTTAQRDAQASGTAERAAFDHHPGTFGHPLHLLRVLAGLFLLVILPGLIAMRWFEVRTWPDRLALVPGMSIALVLLSAIGILAVRRSAFSVADGYASVVVAVAIAAVLHYLARRREAGKAVVVPFVKRSLSLFSDRNFGFLMGAVFLAVLGDGIAQGALAKDIAFGGKAGFSLDQAASAKHLLAVVLLTYVPYTLISPFMGVLIDRFDRRRLLILANGIRAGVIALVGLGVSHLPDGVLIGALILTLASTRLVLAIKSAGLPTVLSGRNLLQGNSISQAGQAIFQLLGAGIALVGTKAVKAGPVIVAGAVVYFIGSLVAARVRNLAEGERKSRLAEVARRVIRNIVEGLREVRRRPAAQLGLTSFLVLRSLVSFTVLVFALEARTILGGHNTDKKAVLIAGAAGALGAAIGFVIAQWLKDRQPPARMIVGAMAVGGVGFMAFGGVKSTLGLSVVAFVAAGAYFVGKISADTIMQQALPDRFRGRGFSLFDVAYNLAWIVPALILFGLYTGGRGRVLLIACGALLVASAALIAAWSRRLGSELPSPQRESAPVGD